MVLDGSLAISKRDLETMAIDDEVQNRLLSNELSDFYLHLSQMQEAPSQRSEDHKKDKARVRKKPTLASPVVDNVTDYEIPSTPPPFSVQASNASSMPITPQKKRIPSDGSTSSYDISSTEITPRRLDKPEQEVQSLQNTMVMALLRVIWRGGIPVPWARNRKMWINYVT